MAKPYQSYKVYIEDTDGSERLGCTVDAKSKDHAKVLARQQGLKKILSAEVQPK